MQKLMNMLLPSTLAHNYKWPHKSLCVCFMVLKIRLNDSLCCSESINVDFKLNNSAAQELWARLQHDAHVRYEVKQEKLQPTLQPRRQMQVINE